MARQQGREGWTREAPRQVEQRRWERPVNVPRARRSARFQEIDIRETHRVHEDAAAAIIRAREGRKTHIWDADHAPTKSERAEVRLNPPADEPAKEDEAELVDEAVPAAALLPDSGCA